MIKGTPNTRTIKLKLIVMDLTDIELQCFCVFETCLGFRCPLFIFVDRTCGKVFFLVRYFTMHFQR
jgi:hypothetical protein